MIEPNFKLLLWIIFVSSIIGAIANIIAGMIGLEKKTHYGISDIVAGLISLILVGWVMISE